MALKPSVAPPVRKWVGLALAVGTTAVAVLVASRVDVYSVSSASMEPTLHCAAAPACRSLDADRILVERLTTRVWGVRRGDIVAISRQSPASRRCQRGSVYVKRVVAIPGDVLAPRLRGGARTGPTLPRRLGADQYFVLGDNRRRSCDSRRFGPIARRDIVGRAWRVPRLVNRWW